MKDFAHIIAQFVMHRLPETTILERNLSKRGNKIYLKYLQSRSGQTVASVYSVSPKPDFTIHNALQRFQRKGDIFAPVLNGGIDMLKVINLLQK